MEFSLRQTSPPTFSDHSRPNATLVGLQTGQPSREPLLCPIKVNDDTFHACIVLRKYKLRTGTVILKLPPPELPCRSTSFLVQDGYCTGQRFLFDGIEAVRLIAENVVRFCDENGRMLKSVSVGTVERNKAA